VLATVAIATCAASSLTSNPRCRQARRDQGRPQARRDPRDRGGDHKKLLDDAAAKKREIEAAEVAEREPRTATRRMPGRPRTSGKIKARATAFGLDAADARRGDGRSQGAHPRGGDRRPAGEGGGRARQTPRQQPQVRLVATRATSCARR
jgi:hypothetical protein